MKNFTLPNFSNIDFNFDADRAISLSTSKPICAGVMITYTIILTSSLFIYVKLYRVPVTRKILKSELFYHNMFIIQWIFYIFHIVHHIYPFLSEEDRNIRIKDIDLRLAILSIMFLIDDVAWLWIYRVTNLIWTIIANFNRYSIHALQICFLKLISHISTLVIFAIFSSTPSEEKLDDYFNLTLDRFVTSLLPATFLVSILLSSRERNYT
ncbi:unnamed protein product [Caenorhabditis angaria]|uniref:Uncharacterized protein n=1 Tax=Caenorhabditis angaria TaxID=860376 RepID=A0A9P1N058_9PELO|nr:unnamed protein product [Caenorhabditis angaria]